MEVYVKTDSGFKELKLSQEIEVDEKKPVSEHGDVVSSAPEKEEPKCDTDTLPEKNSKAVQVSHV